MMHAYDLRLIVSDEWRVSLYTSAKWRRETERQSCLEEMHGESGTEAW